MCCLDNLSILNISYGICYMAINTSAYYVAYLRLLDTCRCTIKASVTVVLDN